MGRSKSDGALGVAGNGHSNSDLGVEPLDDAFDAARLAALLAGAKAPLKSALLDQRRIAGLGDIYVWELIRLFRPGTGEFGGSSERHRRAFDGFDAARIARYGDDERRAGDVNLAV